MDKHSLRSSLPLLQGLRESLRGSLPSCKGPTGPGFSRVTQHRGLGNCKGECVCAVQAQLAVPHWAEEPQSDVSRVRAWAERATLLCLPSTLQQCWTLGAFLSAPPQESSELRWAVPHVLMLPGRAKAELPELGRLQGLHGGLEVPTTGPSSPAPGSQQGRAGGAGCW